MKMNSFEKLNFTVYERLFHRYWSAACQPYATGDALLTLIDQHWQLTSVSSELHAMSSGRYTMVHTFTLVQASAILRVPIVETPFIRKLAQTVAYRRTRVR